MDDFKRDAFLFYRSYWDALRELPDDVCGRLYKAVGAYALDGIEPSFDRGIELVIWKLIKPTLELSRIKSAGGRNGGGNPNLKKCKQVSNTQQTQTESVSKSVSKSVSNTQQTQTESVSKSVSKSVSNTQQTQTESVSKSVSNDKGYKDIRIKDKYNIPSSSKDSEGKSEDETSDAEIQKQEAESFDMREFVLYFNSEIEKANSNIPKIVKITNQRKGFLLARLREYSVENLMTAVTKAATSNFLNGDNSRGWIADFAWIFRPNNFPKVLEGNYDNKKYYGKNRQDNPDNSQSRIKSDIISSAQTAMLRVINGMESEAPEL